MLLLLEGIILNRYLSIVHITYENITSVWNSLPDDVLMADNINIFKKRLNKFWSSCDFVYLFRAQPIETGSVKQLHLECICVLYVLNVL